MTQVWLLQLCLPSLTESGGIDFSHSSRKAWSILNNLTGRSRHSPRHFPVSADAIASQLVRNGKYKPVNRKSSRLVSQEVSDLWRATTPEAVNISDNFSQREFAAALQHLKPGKAPGLDSICSKLILHAGAALKSWYVTSLLPVCADSKFPRSGEERLWSQSPSQQSPWGTQRVIDRYICSVSPKRSSRGLSMPALSH